MALRVGSLGVPGAVDGDLSIGMASQSSAEEVEHLPSPPGVAPHARARRFLPQKATSEGKPQTWGREATTEHMGKRAERNDTHGQSNASQAPPLDQQRTEAQPCACRSGVATAVQRQCDPHRTRGGRASARRAALAVATGAQRTPAGRSRPLPARHRHLTSREPKRSRPAQGGVGGKHRMHGRIEIDR
eukprot:scaffold48853_cov55-Phaeocystis_antarctica.AAC.5